MRTTSILKAGVASCAVGFALAAVPAFAQASTTVDCSVSPNAPECTSSGEIVVTGSILRRTDTETVSPVTTVTTENLDQRGISTVQEGLQSLASNNGPALTNSFSANGAFAAGASAVSLRGLSTNSTLVLFDGLRAAYYPLADDATRNFVDLNTIPDDIVERVEILRDGASSAYGADAIAGVVNIITKREVQGVQARAEAGISERGDAPTYRLAVTGGVGDLETNGFNAYLSGFYYKSDGLYNRDRPYPYNSDDLRNVCGPDGCGPDNRVNSPSGAFPGTAANLIAAPYDAATNTTRLARFQDLNTVGCGERYTLTAAQLAANPSSPASVCVLDYTNLYGVISPDVERWGISGRVTALLGDSIEAYGEVNFLQSTVSYTGFPPVIRGNANTGVFFPRFSTAGFAGGANAVGSYPLSLPVYVCPTGVGTASGLNTGCTAANGTLNPNNPFAAQGNIARIAGRFLDRPTYNETRNRAYRGALGITGPLTDNINFDVSATAMHVDLRRTQNGYIYIQNFLDAIARGTINLVNPSANTQAQWDFISPDNITPATSDQVQFQGILSSELFDLPGGPLQLAVGGSIRYEAVDAPSANSDINGPTQRYFTLNAFGTSGSRWIRSGFFEVAAPIIDQIEVNLSGRYDDYSSGQNAFSPKAGVKFKPIESLLLRATWSKGFRIPSFGEANALPTTGFVSNNASLFNNAYLAQYTVPGNTVGTCSVANFSTAACAPYIRSGSYGQTTLASPDLEPEKSRSFTAGFLFEPIRNVTFAVDYYNIKKTNVITQPSNSPALIAYYNNQPIPAGYTVIPDAVDLSFPNARPRVAFVQSQLINSDTQRTSGLDFSVDAKFDVTPSIAFSTRLEASYIIKLETVFPDGTVERYDGTLGNFNLTAGSGTPKWHGYWLNSVEFGDTYRLTGTANFFGGYDLSAQDQGTGYKDCGFEGGTGGFSPTGCRVPNYVTFDLQASAKINDRFTLSLTALNLFDNLPPVDIVTYGAHLYNPVQGGTGILGRYFKAGVKVNF